MPGARITDEQKRRFFYLYFDMNGPRLPLAKAAEICGFSKSTADRLIRGVRVTSPQDLRREQRDLPPPKPWEELSTDAREALRDFNVFRRLFFADEPQVWAYDAAMRIVEALSREDERTYIDMNIFPGAGKTTLGLRIGCWLICGGGFCDPRRGRAMRLMYGGETLNTARHMTKAIRSALSLRRPFYDLDRDARAELVLAREYGRFRPLRGYDPDTQWRDDQFVVAQMEDVDLYEKEPTVQAASYKSGFLGERVNFAWWDDIATTKNSATPAASDALNTFFTNEAERRIEPGGVLVLVGQRLGPLDLHRRRLEARRRDGSPLYVHIVYPAHQDRYCDGRHRQWDGREEVGAGCLTDARRLPPRDWEAVSEEANYRTVFQQEDTDPEAVLVLPEWLEGGPDREGFDRPGCYDHDRAFGQHPPKEVGPLVNYAVVDPSPTRFWAVEWWAYQPASRFNYLIWGERRKMPAGTERGLLDWNNAEQRFVGLMEDMQRASVLAGQPIRVWVIETNVAQRFLLQFEHYRRWRQRWPDVLVLMHETQLNKLDPAYGVSILSTRYKTGMKRLPAKPAPNLDGLNFMRVFVKELTTYPFAETDDTVLADWMGEFNLPRIVAAARREIGRIVMPDAALPPYLRRRQHEVELQAVG
ncbi:MAG TPA: hypothetical protein VNO79_10675 [Actinomycetota bacterium]|nr:hypothetical protein [Actinomycetota bacterium]